MIARDALIQEVIAEIESARGDLIAAAAATRYMADAQWTYKAADRLRDLSKRLAQIDLGGSGQTDETTKERA